VSKLKRLRAHLPPHLWRKLLRQKQAKKQLPAEELTQPTPVQDQPEDSEVKGTTDERASYRPWQC
jgi:hypothetical protein